MRVLTTRQMREADRRTIEDIGIPSVVLMENAGRQVVAAMDASFDSLDDSRVSVLCGRGNNGGDGFVVARTLAERGVSVSVFLLGQSADVTGDARVYLAACRNVGLDVVEIGDAGAWELHSTDVLGADIVVDALFGTGLHGPISGLAETVVADINASIRPVVSIDLPSGVSADSADVPGPAIDAALTVTLGAPKIPLVLPPAERLAGTLAIADIGIPASIIAGLDGPWLEVVTRDAMRALITPRPRDAHKGDYGHVLVIAGSPGKTGAAALAGMAALRSGAGLVTVATPRSCAQIVASYAPEFMTLALDEAADGTISASTLDRLLAFEADVIAVGPGLGRSPSLTALVRGLVERAGGPLVLDADALNVFAGEADSLVGRDGTDIVITPHPGEMARLTGLSTDAVQANRLDVARDFATSHRVQVILKGHRTLVVSPDGRVSINLTGNPGMATGGTGDVLLGMVAAWCGQGLDPEDATRLAVYLHGLAGDLAESEVGEMALIATDVVSHIGAAILDLTRKPNKTREP